MGLSCAATRGQLSQWAGGRVSVAVDRERVKTGFKPMVVVPGEPGPSRFAAEVGQEPRHPEHPDEELPPERRR